MWLLFAIMGFILILPTVALILLQPRADIGSGICCISIGLLFLAIAGVLGLLEAGKGKTALDRPEDAQVDAWIAEDLQKLVKQAIYKMGLDPDPNMQAGTPLVVRGPVLWQTNGVPATDLLWAKGKDGAVRFAINRITVFNTAHDQLGAYKCDFTFLKGVPLNEETREFYYKDIVSVSTEEESTNFTLPNNVAMVTAQAFKLAVSSGDKISVITNPYKIAELTRGTIPDTGAERVVQVIRTMLRGKKI
jgi:hypothetical protein